MAVTLAKVRLVNLAIYEDIEVLYNPTQLDDSVQVNWATHTPRGLDHEIEQYGHTSSRKTTLEFFLHQDATDSDIQDFRRFLEACTVPHDLGGGVPSGAPPALQVFWPRVLTREVNIHSLKTSYIEFDSNLGPICYRAAIEVSEVRRVRHFSEDLRRAEAFAGADIDNAIEFFQG